MNRRKVGSPADAQRRAARVRIYGKLVQAG
jgi:hypothetical protein